VIVLLLIVLVGSILMNVILLGALASSAGGGAGGFAAGSREQVIRPGSRDNRIAVVAIQGVIMGESRDRLFTLLDRVERDNTIKALVLEVDSPGGGVTESDEIYNRLLRIKSEKNIPVVVSMRSLAASGGYYIACAADEIYAQRTTLTGSIGVLFSRLDLSGIEKYGIRDGTIVSDGAVFKDAGSAMRPMKPEENAYFRGILNNAFDTFKGVITTGRGQHLSKPIEQIANGKIYPASEALALGLIDDIGYLSDAISAAQNRAGLADPQIVRFDREPTFLDLLGMGAQVKASEGGIEVKIDPALIHELTTPRMMYLWPGR
jgi:protease-4